MQAHDGSIREKPGRPAAPASHSPCHAANRRTTTAPATAMAICNRTNTLHEREQGPRTDRRVTKPISGASSAWHWKAKAMRFSRRIRGRGLIEAGTRRPELVVLDLGLPDGDGVDFIRDLRTWSAAPVIVLRRAAARPTRSPRSTPGLTTKVLN